MDGVDNPAASTDACQSAARLCVAPMMELTDRHYRFLVRQISSQALLYTEMLTAQAVVHGDRERLLGYSPAELPVALQLGGSDPALLAEASIIGADYGYSEINLNVGCPSDRVQSGRFGACLMAEPATVAACVVAMRRAVSIPVTVKCRVGIDRNDSYSVFRDFIDEVADTGCIRFAVHARKAWLDGLSPKENREIPPLRYEFVYRLKQERPDLFVVINGGITEVSGIATHLTQVDGVMLGREAYYNPTSMFAADAYVFEQQTTPEAAALTSHDTSIFSRQCEIARQYALHMQSEIDAGVPPSVMTRHLVALFRDVPGARGWRRFLSTRAREYCADSGQGIRQLVDDALDIVVSARVRAAQSAASW